MKETCEGDEVAFQCALVLRSPCGEWLESNDVRTMTERNPPQSLSSKLAATQYGILAPESVSSVTKNRTIASNALYPLDAAHPPVR